MTSLTKILAALSKKSAPRSSAELKSDLAAIDMTKLEARVDEVEQQRRALLLTGSDEDLAVNHAALSAANLAAERGQAAVDELKRRIIEAEGREATEQLEAQAEQAEKAGKHLADTYSEIDALAARIKTLFAEASPSVAAVVRWNRRAEQAGQQDRRLSYVEPTIVKRRLQEAFR